MYKIADFDFQHQNHWKTHRRTLTLLLNAAMRELYSSMRLTHEFSVGNGSFFHIRSKDPLFPADAQIIKQHIQNNISAKIPVKKVELPRNEVLFKLKESNFRQTLDWLLDQDGALPCLYQWGEDIYPFDGELLANTSDVGVWDLIFYPPGLMLHLPPPGSSHLAPFREHPTLFRAFYEAERWGAIAGTSYVSDVNRELQTGRIGELIQIAEALQARKIAEIADRILLTQPRPRIVLVSGPSSSGKTSFSKRLQIQLRLLGLLPRTLGLDNFYKPREEVPRFHNGEYNFEALEALDIDLFNDVLLRLIAGQEVRCPHLDFTTHQRSFSPPISLSPNSILIVEGIHGLNPDLTHQITAPSVFKVYVSALFHLKLDDLNRVHTTDLRFLRRLVRDQRARGYSPHDTFNRWQSVRAGEVKHIFQYQEEADIMFNSALPFELHLLKSRAAKLLNKIHNGDEDQEIDRLLSLLSSVHAIPEDIYEKHLPPNSIAREFIGGSVLTD